MKPWMQTKRGLRRLSLAVLVLAGGVVFTLPESVEGQNARGQARGQSQGQARGATDPAALILDAPTYSLVQSTRNATGLTDDDLATLDLDAEQTQAVLEDLVSWTQRNQRRIERAQARIARSASAQRAAQRAVNMGPRSDQTLRTLSNETQARAQAQADCDALCQEGARQALRRVRPSQRALWESVYDQDPPSARGAQRNRAQQDLVSDYFAAKQGRAVERDRNGRTARESAQRRGLRDARQRRRGQVAQTVQQILPPPAELSEAQPLDELLGPDGNLLDP